MLGPYRMLCLLLLPLLSLLFLTSCVMLGRDQFFSIYYTVNLIHPERINEQEMGKKKGKTRQSLCTSGPKLTHRCWVLSHGACDFMVGPSPKASLFDGNICPGSCFSSGLDAEANRWSPVTLLANKLLWLREIKTQK